MSIFKITVFFWSGIIYFLSIFFKKRGLGRERVKISLISKKAPLVVWTGQIVERLSNCRKANVGSYFFFRVSRGESDMMDGRCALDDLRQAA